MTIDDIALQLSKSKESVPKVESTSFKNLRADDIAWTLLAQGEECTSTSSPNTKSSQDPSVQLLLSFSKQPHAHRDFHTRSFKMRTGCPRLASEAFEPMGMWTKPPIKRKAAQEAEAHIHEQTKPRQYTRGKNSYGDQEVEVEVARSPKVYSHP